MRAVRQLLLFLTVCLSSQVWGGTVALVLSDSGSAYAEFSSALSEALLGTNWRVISTTTGDNMPPVGDSPNLTVTVGSEALRRTLARGETSLIIATLLPRQSYDKLIAEHRRPTGRITAIYLDQPPARQAAFLRHLLPGNKRVGMLVSNETRSLATPYRQAFNAAGMTLDSEDTDTGDTLLPAINALLPRVGALLAIPDGTIYQRSNIKPILISAFRQQRPVIAYSVAFVNAGAMAALHTTASQIAQQTAELITSNPSSLPPPSPPTQFSIAINRTVAQALNLNPPDEAVLRRAMIADRENR